MPSVEPRSQQARMAEAAIIVRILASVLDVDASAWNALLAQQSQPTPFMRHEYLTAFQTTRNTPPPGPPLPPQGRDPGAVPPRARPPPAGTPRSRPRAAVADGVPVVRQREHLI